jgi:hypothetical protein
MQRSETAPAVIAPGLAGSDKQECETTGKWKGDKLSHEIRRTPWAPLARA